MLPETDKPAIVQHVFTRQLLLDICYFNDINKLPADNKFPLIGSVNIVDMLYMS
jgi:hypothetical protein